MNSSKTSDIQKLIQEIKACRKCCNGFENGMANIIAGRPESASKGIGYWTDAFPDFDANLMIVGQDWGDIKTVLKFGRTPEPYCEPGNPTWENLMFFLKEAGFEAADGAYDFKDIYLTNALLCARNGKMTGDKNIKSEYFDNCFPFFNKQIDIIKPKIIATLGKMVFDVFAQKNNIIYKKFDEVVAKEYTLDGFILFPLYHTGYFGTLNGGGRKKILNDFKKLRELFSDKKDLNG